MNSWLHGKFLKAWPVILAAVLLGACSSSGSSSSGAGGYTVGGTITGLSGGQLVLQNNGGDNLTRVDNGGFTFSTLMASGSAYQVTVSSQPAGQSCTVANGSGTIGTTNVTNVTVICAALPPPETFTVGGTISGLNGTVVLRNNGGNNLSRSVNGSFTFTNELADGSAYAVTVLTQPTGQTCEVVSGTGTIDAADVTSVAVTCTDEVYAISGIITGLNGTVVLQNNGGDDLSRSEDGSFTFSTGLTHGSSYNVTVLTHPDGQICSVVGGIGTVNATNIIGIAVTCAGDAYTVGGTIAGLNGTVVLRNNGGDDLTLSVNGDFAFATAIADGSPYNVTVFQQPDGQFCTVTGDSGTIAGAEVDDIEVTCEDLTGLMSCFNPDLYLKNSTVYTAKYLVRRYEPELGFYDISFEITETREVLGAASFNGENNAIQVRVSSVGVDVGLPPNPPGIIPVTDEPEDFTGEFMAYYTADPSGEVRYLGATRDLGEGDGYEPYDLADPYERLVFNLEEGEFIEQTFTLTTNGTPRTKDTVWTYDGDASIDVPAGPIDVCQITGTGHEPSLFVPTTAASNFKIGYGVGTGIPVHIEYLQDNQGAFNDVIMDMRLIEAAIDDEPVH